MDHRCDGAALFNAIDRRIAQVAIGRSHINFSAQDIVAFHVRWLARSRARFSATLRLCPGRCSPGWVGDRDSSWGFRGEFADIGVALIDQLIGIADHLFKAVRGPVEMFAPVITQPLNIAFDRLDIMRIFRCRVGVIKAQVGAPIVFFSGAKIEMDRFGMPDMQIAIGFGWKAVITSLVLPVARSASMRPRIKWVGLLFSPARFSASCVQSYRYFKMRINLWYQLRGEVGSERRRGRVR